MDKSKLLAKLLLSIDGRPEEILFQLDLFEEAMKMGLNKLMLNPVISKEKKKVIIEKLFKDNLSEPLKEMINFLIDDDQLSYFSKIVARYTKLAKQQNRIEMVLITSANELSKEKIAQMAEKLKNTFKIEPIITTLIDQSVLGGVSIKVGDRVFDNTIGRQIDLLSDKLVSSKQ